MITKTIGSSGADYTSFTAAFAANADPTDDITFKAITATAFDASDCDVNLSNANNKRIILTADESVCFRSAASWPSMEAAITQSARITGTVHTHTPNVEVYNLCLGAGLDVDYPTIGGDLIIYGPYNAHAIWHPSSFVTSTFYNIVTFGNFGGLYSGNGTDNLYHCSSSGITGGTFGFRAAGGTVNCYACIAKNHGFGDFSGAGGDYNVSGDTSAPGANSWISQTGVFVNESSGTFDLHLAVAKYGSYPTANYQGSVAALSLDIDNNARPTVNPNCGCDEPAGGGGGATRGMPFGTRGTAFNGGRTFRGLIR